jgi:hypothetical protein
MGSIHVVERVVVAGRHHPDRIHEADAGEQARLRRKHVQETDLQLSDLALARTTRDYAKVCAINVAPLEE